MKDVGDQQTGDYAVMSDLYGRGGSHGARYLYTHKDLVTGRINAMPRSKQDAAQTLAAMTDIGNLTEEELLQRQPKMPQQFS